MSAICDTHKKNVVVELLYNSVHMKFNQFGDQMSWRQDAEEKAPRPPIEQPRKTGKKAVMANRVGVNMLQFCSASYSLSHTTISNKVRGIFF